MFSNWTFNQEGSFDHHGLVHCLTDCNITALREEFCKNFSFNLIL